MKLIHNYILYYHYNLICTEATYNQKKIILLGDIYDYAQPEYDNRRIIGKLIVLDHRNLILKSTKMAGRFVIIIQDKDTIWIYNDTSASRKAYYCNLKGRFACSSSQHLLSRTLGIPSTRDRSKIKYYNSNDFKLNHNSNILDSTYYDDIIQLLPNHILNITSKSVTQYWPNNALSILSNQECVNECAAMI